MDTNHVCMQYGYGGVNGKGAVVEIQNMFACQWGIGGINGKGGVALIKHAIMVNQPFLTCSALMCVVVNKQPPGLTVATDCSRIYQMVLCF